MGLTAANGGSKTGAGGVSALVTMFTEKACGGTLGGAKRSTFGASGSTGEAAGIEWTAGAGNSG